MIRYNITLPVGNNYTLSGTVTTDIALLHDQVLVMLPGPTVNADWFSCTTDTNYDAPTLLTQTDGITVVTLNPLGVGNSSHPTDGSITNTDFQLPYITRALKIIRVILRAKSLGVYGEGGLGGELAIKLAAGNDVDWVACSAMLWKNPTDFTRANAMSPYAQGGLDYLAANNNGYLPTQPTDYDGFLANAPANQAMIDFTHQSQPGLYGTGPLRSLAFADLPTHPLYDPSLAKVDGLIIWGTSDIVAQPGDVEAMALAYGSSGGGHSEYHAVSGGHLMRVGTNAAGPNSEFWTIFRNFLSNHR